MRVLRGRWGVAVGLIALAAVTTACPPPPNPTTVTWTAHRSGGTPASGQANDARVLGTTRDWHLEERATGPSTAPTYTVKAYPRLGATGNGLGPGQTLGAFPQFSAGWLGDQVIAISGPAPGSNVDFFRDAAGTWVAAGSHTLLFDERVVAMTDDTLVVSNDSDAVPALIRVYDLDLVSGNVVVSLNTTISVLSVWGPGFDVGISRADVDGDVLVVTAPNFGSFDSRVGVYRRGPSSWSLESAFIYNDGQAFPAVDDLGTTERVAVGVIGSNSKVRTYVSTPPASEGAPSTWALEQTITPPAQTPDLTNGATFGYSVALDGDVLVTNEVVRSYGAATVGGPDRLVAGAVVFHRAAGTWTYEDRLDPVTLPADTDGLNRAIPAASIHVAGGHVAMSAFVGTTPPPGCGFFCFAVRFEAWRFDRSPSI